MDEMLALLQALDQYISVPNTNVYLRSALGKETQVMLNARAGWSWLAGTSESFWYPHARLYRASIHDDWTQVLGDISKAVNR